MLLAWVVSPHGDRGRRKSGQPGSATQSESDPATVSSRLLHWIEEYSRSDRVGRAVGGDAFCFR